MNDLSPVSLKRSGGSEPAAPCPLPLSFAQERLWFLEQLEPGNVAYLIPHSLRFAVALDARTLEWSLNEILRRHEVLRTRFAAIDGEPAQFVLPWLEFELRIEDLEREERRDAAIARCAREEWSKPFELDRPPLLRARLLRLAERDWFLLVTIHHLVADGWSVGLFERELTALYDARLGRTPPPPPLRLQYADFALWQRQRFEGAELERQLGYWREQLDGAPELLALPTDRARTADRTLRGGTLGFVVAAEALDRLRALGRQGGVTLFMVLTGALAVLLGRAAREDEVVLGTPIAGRLNSEIERLIGLFANTLALRVQLGGDPTVRELLVRVRNTCLAAYEHQELPFERLVEELRPRRDLGHNPIFQVMFTLQNLPTRGAQAAHGQTGELVAAGQGSAKFDLSFSVAESADGLAGALEYSSDLFDTATVERLAEHWVTLLEHFAAGVDRPLGKLSLLREEERRQVVDGWNQTTFDHVELSLDEWFEQTVERLGDAIAVQFGSRELSYRDLDARSNRLAHRLRASGVGPEVRVALCLERSIDLVVALLAVTKAGGAYVPLDPSYPRERLEFMLRDSGAPVVLTVRSLAATLPSLAAETIHLDDADELLGLPSTPPERLLERDPALDRLAYVIYTSGSTGRPKGVAITQRAIVNHMRWMATEFPLEPDDRVLQKTPSSFDASVWEFWAPLLAGAQLVLARPDDHREPARLVDTIHAFGITILQGVPTLLQALVEEPALRRCRSLRRIFAGGEALPAALVARLRAQLGDVPVFNLYGPTEAAIDSTWADGQEPFSGSRVPIGRPIHNAQVYVLDEGGQPAPVGVPGELFIGGRGLARGYLGRPDLTAERFVPDPFASEPGQRLYRTGDLGRHLTDGRIQFLDRLDRQVKLRGFRLELGEIEAHVARLEGVREAVVELRTSRLGTGTSAERLVAYATLEHGAAPLTVATMRERLLPQLPELMIPTALVVLDDLPLTPSGKVDRAALPQPEDVALDRPRVEPRDDIEAVVVGVWAQVLGRDDFGVFDDFFELGGHSLIATRAMARLRDAFDLDLPLRAMFEAPTPAAMAKRLVSESSDRERVAKIAAILVELARLSEEEVEARLTAQPSPEVPSP